MARTFNITSRDAVKKTMRVALNFDGLKKTVIIQDHKNETENLRAMCRELKKYEDSLKIS